MKTIIMLAVVGLLVAGYTLGAVAYKVATPVLALQAQLIEASK